MRFALEGQVGFLADTLPCRDPWGVVTFHLLRPGSKKAKQRAMERLKADPVFLEALAIQVRRGARRPEPKPVNGHGPEVVTDEEQSSPGDTYAAAIEAALDAGRISVLDIIAKDRDLETAIDLVDGWDARDGDGKPVDCTPETVRELLTSDVLVKEGQPHAGEPMGDVLVQHLIAFARNHETARAKYLEAGEKNSAGSSAGA